MRFDEVDHDKIAGIRSVLIEINLSHRAILAHLGELVIGVPQFGGLEMASQILEADP